MPYHDEVYESKAEQYERLISREDYLNMIPQIFNNICSFKPPVIESEVIFLKFYCSHAFLPKLINVEYSYRIYRA